MLYSVKESAPATLAWLLKKVELQGDAVVLRERIIVL
jgi:hypothetical protein